MILLEELPALTVLLEAHHAVARLYELVPLPGHNTRALSGVGVAAASFGIWVDGIELLVEAFSLMRPVELGVGVAVFQSGVFLLQMDCAVGGLLVDLHHLVLDLRSGLLCEVGALLLGPCVVQPQLGVQVALLLHIEVLHLVGLLVAQDVAVVAVGSLSLVERRQLFGGFRLLLLVLALGVDEALGVLLVHGPEKLLADPLLGRVVGNGCERLVGLRGLGVLLVGLCVADR